MALSGSNDFAVTRDDLIKTSLQHIGAIGDGETPNATQLSECSILLNMLIKHLQADDIQLWITKYGYVFPVSSTSSVLLGAEGGNAASSYVHTTTSAAAIAGASTITVTTVTGIATTNIIGIELSDGTMQWTTVNGAPVGSVVTLSAVLTGAVASGADIYAYATTAKLTRPARILEVFRRASADTTDTPVMMLSAAEYNNLSDKTATGEVLQFFYDQPLGLSTTGYPGNGEFFFWPRFQNGDSVLVLRYTKIFDDMDAGSNNVEFPQVWFLPLMVGLAWLLAPKHGIPLKERQMLMQEYMFLKSAASSYDQESGSMFLQPDMGYK